MAKDKKENKQTNDNEKSQAATPQISVAAQYVKDISFESPGAPHTLRPTEERPSINVTVDVKAQAIGKDTYEVELKVGASAARKNKEGKDETVFICEVEYAGVFVIVGIPKEEMEPALLIYCPGMLFPYARRVISDLTRDGGFPALLLDPIDFGKLYLQREKISDKK